VSHSGAGASVIMVRRPSGERRENPGHPRDG
jgi:hypothetical protein